MRKHRVLLYFVIVILLTLLNFYYRPISKNPLITDSYRKSEAYVNDLYKSDEFFKNHLSSKESKRLYENILADIKSGKSSSDFLCQDCISYFREIHYALFLDHPELIAFQNAHASGNSQHIKYDYYRLSPLKTYLGTRRIAREMDIIRRETKKMSDKEKIIYVYDYVAKHNYDYVFMYSNSNQSAYSFFTKGSSVCAGFAKASQIIFQNIGISSYLVLSEEHMWNYVQYEGKYYVFDATMGTSSLYKSEHFYDGLGQTTIGEVTGLYAKYYPKIDETPLKDIFGL